MSANNIPFDLQVEIIRKVLPVKSLVRFRSVSKQWKSLIDSSWFIIDHTVNQTQPYHLLIRTNEDKYVSIVDDDSFPHNKFSLVPPPPNVMSIPHSTMLDCSHGLVCSYYFHDLPIADGKEVVVLWNPSIRKSVEIVLPYGSITITVVGFGVCPKTCDPKIVMVRADWKAEIFTLSTGSWRTISMNLCQRLKSFSLELNQVVMDGVIHWVAYDLDYANAVIISFDLTSEEFGEIAFPDSLSRPCYQLIFKLKESLALIDCKFNLYDVWMMIKNGDPKSPFTKLFTIDFETLTYNVIIGFRMNGQPIVEEIDTCDEANLTAKFKAYEPCSKHMKDLEIDTTYDSGFWNTTSYTESLILLNHSTSIIY